MTSEPSMLDQIIGDLANDPDYVAEGLALGVVEDALAIMESKGMNKARLADAMHVSRAYVTKVFNAPPNLTLRTIAQLALAVGARPVLRLEPMDTAATRPASSGIATNLHPLRDSLAHGILVAAPGTRVTTLGLSSIDWPSILPAIGWPSTIPLTPTMGVSPLLTHTTEDPCNYQMDSRPTLLKSADLSPRASAKLTPSISSTVSTTTAPSMAA